MSSIFPSHAARAAIAAALALLAATPVAAGETAGDPAQTLRVLSASEPVAVKSDISGELQPAPAFEAPPVVVKTASGAFLLATTAWSWWCADKRDILVGPLHLGPDNCKLFSFPERIDPHLRNDPRTGMSVSAEVLKHGSEDWRQNYSGAMSAVKLDRQWGGYDVVAAVHGENKNERFGDLLYANTVNTDVSPATCADGVVNGAYAGCWQAYNAFISLAFLNTKTGRKLDIGPVLWPSVGYVANGKKVSGGVRHPSLFLTDKYLYIYYLDTSLGGDPERRGGIHVARIELGPSSPTSLKAVPSLHGGFSDDNPSLPPGFDKQTIRQFYGLAGGRSDALWPSKGEDDRFSVTRIRNTPYFLGVEEYGTGKNWGLNLRLSSDLAHWSDPVAIPGMTASNWANGKMHYPVFSDATGEDSQSIDPNDFYLVGSDSRTGVVRQHLSVQVSETPKP